MEGWGLEIGDWGLRGLASFVFIRSCVSEFFGVALYTVVVVVALSTGGVTVTVGGDYTVKRG